MDRRAQLQLLVDVAVGLAAGLVATCATDLAQGPLRPGDADQRQAPLPRSPGNGRKAHDVLAPVYGGFTQGFDTPGLMEAKALLDALG